MPEHLREGGDMIAEPEPETWNHESILRYAQKMRCKVDDLIVLAKDNDPFFIGTDTHLKMAEWYSKIYVEMDKNKTNPRSIHYFAYAKQMPKWDGAQYLNTDNNSKYVGNASKYARYLGLVSYESVTDVKNPDPIINREYGNSRIYFPYSNTIGFDFERGTEVDFDDWVESLSNSAAALVKSEISNSDLQPYHIEVFIEKEDMNDVLQPICYENDINLQAFKGEGSLSAASLFVDRIKGISKKVRIFYISDFDPKGLSMPIGFARKVEKRVSDLGIQEKIKIKQLALTKKQVIKYELPRVPIKDTDLCKKNFEEKNGEGAAELDAIEAIHKGLLREIIEHAIKPYIDTEIGGRAENKVDEVKQQIHSLVHNKFNRDELKAHVNTFNELLRERDAIREPYQDRIEAVKQQISQIEDEMKNATSESSIKIEKQRDLVKQRMPNIDLSCIDMSLPLSTLEVSENDADWLYDSGRDYLTQLKHYRGASVQEAGGTE